MQEFRRVLIKNKYAAIFMLLILMNIIVLYQEQSNINSGNNIFTYGQIYRETVKEIGSGDLAQIKNELKERQKAHESINIALDTYLAENETIEGFDRAYPNLSKHLDENNTETFFYEQQIVESLLIQAEALESYSDYLVQIQNRKERIAKFSFLQSEDDFAMRNIEKTANDFLPLQDVDIEFGSDKAVTAFSLYRLPDFISLIVIMLFCLKFGEDRRKGLRELCRSLPRGRRWLTLNRISILFVLSFSTTIFLYLASLMECFILYGGNRELNRSIQSISIFQTCTLHISVLQYLIIYFVLRLFATFLLSLVIWNLLRIFEEIKYSILLATTVLTAEYCLYNFIPEQSYINILKYINLFSFINIEPLLQGYYNLNIFGYPFSYRQTIILLLLPCIIIIVLICMREKNTTNARKIIGINYITKIKDRLISKLHSFGFELYKLLIIQKGMLIIIVLLIVLMNFQFISYIPQNEIERQTETYLTQLEGEITDNTISRIERIQSVIDEKKRDFAQVESDYNNEMIPYADYYKNVRDFDNTMIQDAALNEIKGRIASIQRLQQSAIENKPWLVSEYSYNKMYGYLVNRDEQDADSNFRQHLLGILSLLSICLLTASIFSYENQSGINNLHRTMARNIRLFSNKIMLSSLLSVVTWLMINGFEVYCFYRETHFRALNAPVQSLSSFTDFPISTSIVGFLLIVYLLRFINLWCVSCMVMLVSSLCKQLAQATLVSIILFVIPSIIYSIFSIHMFRYVALSTPLSVIGTLLVDGGNIRNCISTTSLLLFCATIALLRIYFSTYSDNAKRQVIIPTDEAIPPK